MSSDSDSEDDNSYETMRNLVMHQQHNMNMLCSGAAVIFGKYCESWVMKAEPRKSILSGFGWLQETIATPGETYTMLRMPGFVFFDLHDLLVRNYGLKETPLLALMSLLLCSCGHWEVVNQIEELKIASNIQRILSIVNSMRFYNV